MGRRQDSEFEQTVAQYMDAYFWSKSKYKFQRVTQKDLQVQGVDVIYRQSMIDEKIKNTRSINEIFQYPSVEIMITNRMGDRQPGWFAANNVITTHYSYLSVFSDKLNPYDVNLADIEKVNVMLFSKKEMTDFISAVKPIKQILEDAMKMDQWNDRIDYYDEGRKIFHLKYSTKEGAVCLVLKRDQYLNLKSTVEFDVYPQKTIRVSK